MGLAVISIGVQSRALVLVSAYLAIVLTGVLGPDLGQNGLIAAALALHFLIFAGSTYFYSHQNNTMLGEGEAWCFLPVLLIFYALEYHFVSLIYPGLAPWLSLGFAGVLMGLYGVSRKRFPDNLGSQALVIAFAALVFFHAVYIELLPENTRTYLFVVIMLAVAFAPLKPGTLKPSRALVIPILVVCAILAIEYISMLAHLMEGYKVRWPPFVRQKIEKLRWKPTLVEEAGCYTGFHVF